MSSILKALEKAEESNSTKRQAAESGLIRSRKSRPGWVMPAAVLCGAGIAALATFAAMGGFSGHAPAAPAVGVAKALPAVASPATVNPAPAPAQILPAAPAGTPLAPNQQVAPVVNQQAVPVANQQAAPVANRQTAPVASQKAVSVATLNTVPLVKSKAMLLPVGKARVAGSVAPVPASVQPAPAQAMAPARPAPVPEVTPVVPAAPARPELKVSGIAWQNNGESSFAVVNGRAVLQGGSVDGYKVLEIRKDSVKFSGANGNFEVLLEEQ